MTYISGSMSPQSMMSPNDRLKLQLQSAVSAGTISSTDQSALSNALDDIDTAMKADGPPQPGTDPSSIKTKVDSLVDQEVSDGKLTDAQASELKQLFANAAQQGPNAQSADASDSNGNVQSVDGTQAMTGPGGPCGPGGPPPPPPPSGDNNDASDSSTSSTSTDTTKQTIEQLIAFLKQLEQATSSSTVYASNGSSTGSNVSSLLVDGNA